MHGFRDDVTSAPFFFFFLSALSAQSQSAHKLKLPVAFRLSPFATFHYSFATPYAFFAFVRKAL